jgi:hypothetical protein
MDQNIVGRIHLPELMGQVPDATATCVGGIRRVRGLLLKESRS